MACDRQAGAGELRNETSEKEEKARHAEKHTGTPSTPHKTVVVRCPRDSYDDLGAHLPKKDNLN